MPKLIVVRPGMLTTVQDLGRWGRQGAGVPVAGPMDAYSHRLANRLVGNPESAAAVEVTLIGPDLEAQGEVVAAVAGAEFTLLVNGESVPTHQRFVLPSGSRLRFGPRTAGARAVLAVRGGLAVDAVFGSRATSLISRIGPFGGRPLAAGDVLPVGDGGALTDPDSVTRAAPLDLPRGGARLRVIRGPHELLFTHAAFDHLFSARFLITPSSNRMGYRLEGPVLKHSGKADILSDATPMGSLQVPASGQPIVLMADRQTTGGYPKIATVITADLPVAGQLAPGDWIEFAPCTREAATEALQRQRRRLEGPRP
jgi:antagonist of KipI